VTRDGAWGLDKGASDGTYMQGAREAGEDAGGKAEDVGGEVEYAVRDVVINVGIVSE
jgi:hypothetical protein